MSGKVGVVLAGCGYLDGAEVNEAVLALYFLERAGYTVEVLAPDRDQHHVMDHQAAAPVEGQARNVLLESARIARGGVRELSKGQGADYDALVLPGGFGVAKNLSSFATEGGDCAVDQELTRLIGECVAAKKPVVALCIAPAALAAAFRDLGHEGVRLTIGTDAGTAAAIEQRCRRSSCRT